MVGLSTCAEEFSDFLEMVANSVGQLPANVDKPILVLDNATAHHAHAVRSKLERFQVRFLPAHSSPLNSIERLWALIKGRFRQLLGLSKVNAPTTWA